MELVKFLTFGTHKVVLSTMCTRSDMHALTHMHTGELTSDYRVDGLMFFHTVLLSHSFIQICPGHTSLLADRFT